LLLKKQTFYRQTLVLISCKIATYFIKAFDKVRNQILSVLEMHRRPRVFEMPPLQYPVKRTSRVPVSVNEAPCRLLEIQGMSVCTFWKVDHNEYVLGRKIRRENHELSFFKLGEARENLIPGFSLNKRNKMPSPKNWFSHV